MTFDTSLRSSPTSLSSDPTSTSISSFANHNGWRPSRFQPHGDGSPPSIVININDGGSTGRGILIGVLSAFGSAGVAVLVLAIFFFFKYTSRGRILLDRIGRPGEYDDEQAFAHEEAEALETMDELQRTEYLRAKGGNILILVHAVILTRLQLLPKRILQSPRKPIYHFHSS